MTIRNVFIATVLLMAGCFSPRVNFVDVAFAREFFRQSTVDQQKTLKNYSLENQYGIYLFGNQIRHPPALYLARCFGLNGRPAVELLSLKLDMELDDLTVRDIAMLLATIDSIGKYDVVGDVSLMAKLRVQVAKMTDAGWRDTAERMVVDIGRHREGASNDTSSCE